jgi:hypothetical protein
MRLAIPLLIGATLGLSVIAFPSGAGSCASGVDSVQGVHLTRTTVTTGSLEDGGFSVALSEATLVAGTTSSFTISTDNNLIITGTKTFRGFLMRLGETDTATVDAFTAAGSEIQVSSLCTGSEGVGGVTHTSASDKSSVTAILNLDASAAAMPLDVIIVVSNSDAESEFYYTRFLLTAGFDETAIPVTPAPNPSTLAPIANTPAPVTSDAPATPAPVAKTPAPVPRTQAPVPRTQAPVPRTPAPVPRTPAPIPRTTAPASVVRTPAPIMPTAVPGQPTSVPAPTTRAPVLPTTQVPDQPTIATLPTRAPAKSVPKTGGKSGGMGKKGMGKRKKRGKRMERKGRTKRSMGRTASKR